MGRDSDLDADVEDEVLNSSCDKHCTVQSRVFCNDLSKFCDDMSNLREAVERYTRGGSGVNKNRLEQRGICTRYLCPCVNKIYFSVGDLQEELAICLKIGSLDDAPSSLKNVTVCRIETEMGSFLVFYGVLRQSGDLSEFPVPLQVRMVRESNGFLFFEVKRSRCATLLDLKLDSVGYALVCCTFQEVRECQSKRCRYHKASNDARQVNLNFLRCKACYEAVPRRYVLYCGKKCQQADWASHRALCSKKCSTEKTDVGYFKQAEEGVDGPLSLPVDVLRAGGGGRGAIETMDPAFVPSCVVVKQEQVACVAVYPETEEELLSSVETERRARLFFCGYYGGWGYTLFPVETRKFETGGGPDLLFIAVRCLFDNLHRCELIKGSHVKDSSGSMFLVVGRFDSGELIQFIVNLDLRVFRINKCVNHPDGEMMLEVERNTTNGAKSGTECYISAQRLIFTCIAATSVMSGTGRPIRGGGVWVAGSNLTDQERSGRFSTRSENDIVERFCLDVTNAMLRITPDENKVDRSALGLHEVDAREVKIGDGIALPFDFFYKCLGCCSYTQSVLGIPGANRVALTEFMCPFGARIYFFCRALFDDNLQINEITRALGGHHMMLKKCAEETSERPLKMVCVMFRERKCTNCKRLVHRTFRHTLLTCKWCSGKDLLYNGMYCSYQCMSEDHERHEPRCYRPDYALK